MYFSQAVWQTKGFVSLRNGTRLPLWAGLLNPFSSSMYLLAMEASVKWGGVEVATVNEKGLWVPILPNSAQLTGTNMSDALHADVVVSPQTLPVLEAMLAELGEAGFVHIALQGTFGLRLGNLILNFHYWQAQNVPCCDLAYAQSHNASSSECNNPPTDKIKGSEDGG
jgi:hypothetical protein